ncbi:MAG: cupin domain-containing protein [Acidobacteria bacterium]|nr:cupin domain-containing protein [Acidobacteriota bacterium]
MRFLLCLAFLPALAAQSTTVLDNPTVRVIDALDQPHRKGALHKHDYPRVMIYLTDGDLDIATQDGHVEHQHWKAGDVAWSPAGGLHTSENVGEAPLRIIEVEIKSPPPPAPLKRNPALDPLALDPKRNHLLFENPLARVFISTLEVDGREKWHEHAGARLAVLLTPLSARVEFPKKQPAPMNGGPGDVFWSLEPVRHRTTNLGARPARIVVVEVK